MAFSQLEGFSENGAEVLLYSGLNKMQQGDYSGAVGYLKISYLSKICLCQKHNGI
jgi:hypothetical protein